MQTAQKPRRLEAIFLIESKIVETIGLETRLHGFKNGISKTELLEQKLD